jgi:hypothetical protein
MKKPPIAVDEIKGKLQAWEDSLCKDISLSGLMSRSPIAHKWKATYRILTLRETSSWRMNDLLMQSLELFINGSLLGARILARSALETLAILIKLNQMLRQILDDEISFDELHNQTVRLLLGSGDKSTNHDAMRIGKILQKCDTKYVGISNIYIDLSESAHPNHHGLCRGYSEVDNTDYTTYFKNRWIQLHKEGHLELLNLLIIVFHQEYNDEFLVVFEELENWLVKNDQYLESIGYVHSID